MHQVVTLSSAVGNIYRNIFLAMKTDSTKRTRNFSAILFAPSLRINQNLYIRIGKC